MHDGKIIEGKKLKPVKEVKTHSLELRNIIFGNKLLLGLRNVFNIKVKFVLLFLVYFFLTIIVFSEYSSLRKINYDQSDFGFNYYFSDYSANRVIMNKKDKTSFSYEELENIKNTDNGESVVEDDLFLDSIFSLYNDEIYFSGPASNIQSIHKVDIGKLPENDNEVIVEVSEYDYYVDTYKEELLNKEFTLRNDTNNIVKDEKLKICGIIYNNDYSIYDMNNKLYLSNTVMNEMRKGNNIFYSTIELSINNHIFSTQDYNFLFTVKPNSKVNDGEVLVMQELNNYCKNYNCTGDPLNIKIKNIYYEDAVDLKVKNYYKKDNFNYLTGLKNYEENASTIFMNENDYNRLFTKDSYQISVFLSDTKKSSETINTLESSGYNTIYMRDILVDEIGEFRGIIKIIRGVMFLIATIVLFFISYFIIKIILKSRNVYFSTIRILGSTKKQAKQLLSIELLLDINIAYFVFILLVVLVKSNLLNSDYIKDMVTYFGIIDYILIYIVLTIMSLLISNRYAHKLFKNSVMSTYREEA